MDENKKCQCNDLYEQINKQKAESNINVKYCYLQGPPGPTGPAGPVTITVGKVETTEAKTEASVTNSGSNTDVILDFKIPKGDKGETGEQGQTGEPGPEGKPGTTTIESYGEKYLTKKEDLKLTASTDTIVPLNEIGPSKNINSDTENTIQINQSGTYLISFYFSAKPNKSCNLNISVMKGNTLLTGSNVSVSWEPSFQKDVSGTLISNLSSDDKITLNVRSDIEVDLSFDGNTDAILTLTKIG